MMVQSSPASPRLLETTCARFEGDATVCRACRQYAVAQRRDAVDASVRCDTAATPTRARSCETSRVAIRRPRRARDKECVPGRSRGPNPRRSFRASYLGPPSRSCDDQRSSRSAEAPASWTVTYNAPIRATSDVGTPPSGHAASRLHCPASLTGESCSSCDAPLASTPATYKMSVGRNADCGRQRDGQARQCPQRRNIAVQQQLHHSIAAQREGLMTIADDRQAARCPDLRASRASIHLLRFPP